MPRRAKPKGPGQGNRTDLAIAGNTDQPVRVPTGGAYGSATASAASQQAAPLPQVTAPVAAGGQPTPPPAADPLGQAVADAQAHDFQPVPIGAPSERPNEHVMAGAPLGPGGGPEILQRGVGMTSNTLQQVATMTGDPEFQALARQAQMLGL